MRLLKVLPVVAMCALVATAGGVDSAAAAEQSLVRVAYVSPDATAADVYIDAVRTLSNVSYKTVSAYIAVTVGAHTVAVRPAGSASTTAPWAQVSQAFSAGAYYTVAIGGRFGQLQATAFQDQFAAPSGGQAVARFIHMAPDVPAVDVVVKGGPILFSNISFLQASAYKSLPSGTYDLQLVATGTTQVLFTAPSVVVASDTIHSETGIGGVGAPVELLQIADASSARAPVGGANTGGGGLAPRPSAPGGLAAAGLIAAALLLLVVTAIRRSSGHAS
ncbi:MAG: DUF4397 domain-containing protein [Candidatus Dormibacteraeota bacterium]|uniref:DUF4397 domain-containing protein n=1 Tax=Candidatus Aeolococcus gillhamiae TaxID=3127015 RepID=A0A934N2A0_9BACT|nr:DUF4397 domain-containing protein [Candidatus Dormibacteraeota bacterium]